MKEFGFVCGVGYFPCYELFAKFSGIYGMIKFATNCQPPSFYRKLTTSEGSAGF